MDLLSNCTTCYPYQLSEYPNPIVIEGNIPAGDYYFKVTDKFNNSFVTNLVTVGVNGIATIYTALIAGTPDIPSSFPVAIPAAWLNKDAGKFYVEYSTDVNKWIPLPFTFSTVAYQCLVLEFAFNTGDINTVK